MRWLGSRQPYPGLIAPDAVSGTGFTLIEALVTLFLFSVITVTFYSVFSIGTQAILESKNRIAAIGLANERLEIARNLEYDNVGTTSGIPDGSLEETDTIAVSNRTFTIHTFVQYVDDAYDGKVSGTTPLDTVPNDYKRVQIEVSWGEGGSDQRVFLTGLFVPDGMEQAAGGGVLSINVLDLSGSGIGQADVRVVNASVSPAVDLTAETDALGNLALPEAPASSQEYELTVSKGGYYTVTTYPPPPASAFDPLEAHASVVAGALNQVTLVTNQATDLELRTRDPLGQAVANVTYHIAGGKQIGTNSAVPVYDFDQDNDSGAGAAVEYPGRMAGSYTLSDIDDDYVFLGLSTQGPNKDICTLSGGGSQTVDMLLGPVDFASLLVIVTEEVTTQPIQGAQARVTNTLSGYDTMVTTDRYGQAYFPTELPALVAGTYDIEVSAAGYENATDSETVTTQLVSSGITLDPL